MRVRIAALTILAAFVGPLAACGNLINIDVDGLVGLEHDGEGGIIVHVAVCNNETKRVVFVKQGLSDEIGAFETETPEKGYFSFALDNPSPWVSTQDLKLPDDPSTTFRVEAEPEEYGGPEPFFASKVITSVSVNYKALTSRDPGEILVDAYFPTMNHGAVTLQQFKSRHECTA